MTDSENNVDVNEANDNTSSNTSTVESAPAEAVVEDVVVESQPVKSEETKSENVIGSGTASPKPTEKPAIAPVANGVIGSGTSTPKKVAPKVAATTNDKVQKVAIFSSRNIVWQGVGKIVKGYNFVDALEADKWLTLDNVRKVDPQEVKALLG